MVLKATDANGIIIAGCTAQIDAWGVAAIDALWVEKPYRRQGMGTAILREAERVAAAKGCYLSLVGTFDFNAVGFWEAQGYALHNIWEGYPAGHDNYSLAKRLRPALAAAAPTPRWIAEGTAEDGEYVESLVADYNHCRVPYAHPHQPYDKKIEGPDGLPIAGYMAANSGWDVAFLELMWVDEPYRGQGLGTALLADAEAEARARGARIVLLGAYDWQVDFFKTHGYVVTGELRDCPKGHVYFSLQKRLV